MSVKCNAFDDDLELCSNVSKGIDAAKLQADVELVETWSTGWGFV